MAAPRLSEPREERISRLGYDYAGRAFEPVTTCNLCGGSVLVEVSRVDRYGFPARCCLCAACGLGFLAPRLTRGEYTHFYEAVYRPLVSAYHGRLIDAETVQDEQREYARELVSFLDSSMVVAPARVLDVGGSTGVVAGAVRDAFGSAATVVDPSPEELAVAARQGIETVQGFAEEADLPEGGFDLVLLCQTIDHLVDVSATLAALRRWIAPGGRAFVDVLDLDFMMRRRGSVEGAVKIDHPYYLTRGTAGAYLSLAGFDIVAERLSADGHWGFLVAPGPATTPDWGLLRAEADRRLELLWALRASA